MTECSAPAVPLTQPPATDEEAAAILAAVLALRNQVAAKSFPKVTPTSTRWSRAARREMTRSFERTREE